uniref:Uncharacterized protein n=1 Tax=Arundo donax TaxID=35708 RepID=A0A0A8YDH8_ARUDO
MNSVQLSFVQGTYKIKLIYQMSKFGDRNEVQHFVMFGTEVE